MAILELVAVNEPIGLRLAELCDMIGAPKSSVHGLVRGLVTTGYLRETQGRYCRGPASAMLTIGSEQIPAVLSSCSAGADRRLERNRVPCHPGGRLRYQH